MATLRTIVNGVLADAEDLNFNFNALNNDVSSTQNNINSVNSSLSSQLSNLKTSLESSINNINSLIKDSTVPTGTIIYHSKIPSGYLRCDGSLVSRTEYSNLFTAIGTTFGAGDGSTTFALPKLTDGRFIEGHTSAGTYIEAGLPNIVGTMTNAYRGTVSGCFYYNGESSNGGDDKTTCHVGFNASLSNSIYGKSSTVQPEALTLVPCIKY